MRLWPRLGLVALRVLTPICSVMALWYLAIWFSGLPAFVIPRPGYVRIVVREDDPPADKDTPVTLDRLQAQVDAVLGRHVELRAPRWLSRFGDAARLAERYRSGHVLLAGDAAHIHPPAGAIG